MTRRAASLWASFLLLNVLLVPFCLFGLHSNDTDTFYHLAGGRWMFENGKLLDHETFSFLIPGRPWTNYYWGFEWLLFAVYRLAGLGGVLALRAAVMVPTANLFLDWVYRRTGGALPETLAFGLMPLALYVPRALNVRPHLFSYLFLLASLVLLDEFMRGRKWVGIGLAILCAFWANLHGVEYPIVLAAIALYACDGLRPHLRRSVREMMSDPQVLRWPLLVVGCAAAFLANPFGLKLLATPRIGANAEAMAQIIEMIPSPLSSFGNLFPDLNLDSETVFHYAVWVGAFLLPGWIRRGKLLSIGFYTLGLALALNKRRFEVEFLILAVPFIAEAVAESRRRLTGHGPSVRNLLLALAVYIVVGTTTTVLTMVREGHLTLVSTDAYPVGAMNYIQHYGLAGNLYCTPSISGYVTWRAYPQVRTLMDMRTPEPFGPQELWLSSAIGDAVSFDRLEERRPIDLVLLIRGKPPAAKLRSDPRFAPVYADSRFVLFAHKRILVDKRAALPLKTLSLMEDLEGSITGTREIPSDFREEALRLADVWPANSLAQRALLWLLLSERRFTEAHLRAAELTNRSPREGLYPFFDGLALNQLGQTKDAAAAFQRAIDVVPEFVLPYSALADSLMRLGRNDEALAVMERLVWHRWTSVNADEYILLGRLRQRAGRMNAAIDAFERARWLLPPDAPTLPDLDNDLALGYLARGEAARALPLLEDALARRSPFPPAALNRARALRLLGRRTEANLVLEGLARDSNLPLTFQQAVSAEMRRLANDATRPD